MAGAARRLRGIYLGRLRVLGRPPTNVHALGYRDWVGFLAIRHRLNDFLLELGGHIGYSVRPSRRREGHAGAALALAVREARDHLDLRHVLVTCDEDNVASLRTIESTGGILEDTRQGKRRYWITT